jgi:SAM-dependent methyltransferase
MNQDERAPFVRALQRARASAYAPGEFVEQESFMRAAEIRALAGRAGIGPGVSVLDLCCGVAGPGRFITRELGCTYLGVDSSSSALDIARERAGDLPCRFEVARIPPIPPGPFDVVLLLETMLAFPEKETLLEEVSRALRPDGRFAFTLEEGLPLTEPERERMPDADTIWLTPLREMLTCLERVGLRVRWHEDFSRSHRAVADSLLNAFAADASAIAEQIGRRALEELLAAHRLWSDWLQEGRVRKIAFVAEKGETHRGRHSVGLGTSSDAPRGGPPSERELPGPEDDEKPGGEAEHDGEPVDHQVLARFGMFLEIERRDHPERRDSDARAPNGCRGDFRSRPRPPARPPARELRAYGSHEPGEPSRHRRKKDDQGGQSCDREGCPRLDRRARRRLPRGLLDRHPSGADFRDPGRTNPSGRSSRRWGRASILNGLPDAEAVTRQRERTEQQSRRRADEEKNPWYPDLLSQDEFCRSAVASWLP